MVIPLKVRLERKGVDTLAVQRFGRRGWNSILRTALLNVAHIWAKRMLPLKFQANARSHYKFLKRSSRYQAKKERFARDGLIPVRVGNTITVIRGGGFVPQDLVYTGAMRDQVLSQAYRPQATVTSTRQRVKVPIPLGHIVQRQTAAEVAMLPMDELQELHRLAFQEVMQAIREQGVEETMGAA